MEYLGTFDFTNATVTGVGFAGWKTIGSAGADYLDVQAMLDGGFNQGILITDVTEDSDVVVPSTGLFIQLAQFNLDMAANKFTFAGAYSLNVEGYSADLSRLTFAQTVTNNDLISGNATARISFRNMTIDNDSTQTACKVIENSNGIPFVENVRVECPNQFQCGFYTTDIEAVFNNVEFVTGGSSTSGCIEMIDGHATNLTFTGTFSNSSLPVFLIGGSQGATLKGLIASGNMAITVQGAASVSDIQFAGALTPILKLSGDISNSDFAAGVLNNNAGDGKFSNVSCSIASMSATNAKTKFSGCELSGAAQMKGDNMMFSSCAFTGNVTTTSDCDASSFTGCHFAGTLTVNSGSVRNMFANNTILGAVTLNDQTIMTGNVVGANAGGGAATITIAAGTDSVITNNLVDADISDSGTTTELSGNRTY